MTDADVPLERLIPLAKAPLPMSQRSRERAWQVGTPVGGQRVRLRIVRVGRKIFTTRAWCEAYVTDCTLAGERPPAEPPRLLRAAERERKARTAAILARHGIELPATAGAP